MMLQPENNCSFRNIQAICAWFCENFANYHVLMGTPQC